jgi:hypothetical protein
MWRVHAFYKTSSSPSDDNGLLSFLHGRVRVFETEVDQPGNAFEKVWEWK